jgi:hypothetical protein
VTTFTEYVRDPVTGQILFGSDGSPQVVPNPAANTYGGMIQRVTYEVLGSPIASDVTNAIQDAIAQFERETFWFNDMRTFGGVTGSLSDLQTVLGKEFYSAQDLPTLINMPHIRKILVYAFQNRYPLEYRTMGWIDDQSISPVWNGLPTDWSWQAGALRLYPIPNGQYPLILDGTIRFADLVNPTDSNPWVNEAEWLIRSEAKRLLFTNITRDADQAAMMEREIYGTPQRQGALAQLRRESGRRAGGPGALRGSRGWM